MNAAFREAAAGSAKGFLAVCDEPLVSVDFRCSDVSTTIDSSLTMVMGVPSILHHGHCPLLARSFFYCGMNGFAFISV